MTMFGPVFFREMLRFLFELKVGLNYDHHDGVDHRRNAE